MLTTQFLPFPNLETQRLQLRQVTANDVPAVFALRSNKEVMRYLDRPLAKSPDDALSLINLIASSLEKSDGITWGVCLKESPLALKGTIGFWRMEKEHYRAEIGYMLHPSLQGLGLMQEAVESVLQYGFHTLKLHSVEANVNPNNAASIRLLERNGFVREAYFRENYFHNGAFYDSAVYSLLSPLPFAIGTNAGDEHQKTV